MLLGAILLLIVPDTKNVWIHIFSILGETVGLKETDYIGAFLSFRLIEWLVLS
jgi:hypothetical protein